MSNTHDSRSRRHTQSNFEIRHAIRHVTSDRLCTTLRVMVTIKLFFAAIPCIHYIRMTVMVSHLNCILPEVTSHLISKLDSVHVRLGDTILNLPFKQLALLCLVCPNFGVFFSGSSNILLYCPQFAGVVHVSNHWILAHAPVPNFDVP